MKQLFSFLVLSLALTGLIPAAVAVDTADPLTAPEREAIVHLVTQATVQDLDIEPARLRLAPKLFNHSGDWVFLTADMQDASGQRFDYAGTESHEEAQNGWVSSTVGALLRREGGTWALVDIAIGPTDVAWDGWDELYQAPASIFGFPETN